MSGEGVIKKLTDQKITSNFTDHVSQYRPGGIDYATIEGDKYTVLEDGVFKGSYTDQYGGRYITIQGKSGLWLYVHISDYNRKLKIGDLVKIGDFAFISGNTGWTTGPHTHAGLNQNGILVNPAPYILKNKQMNYEVRVEHRYVVDGVKKVDIKLRAQYDTEKEARYYHNFVVKYWVEGNFVKIYKRDDNGVWRTFTTPQQTKVKPQSIDVTTLKKDIVNQLHTLEGRYI